MTTGKNAHLNTSLSVRMELLSILNGMDYCLDWKSDPSEWSARELVYHILDTPPGGVHNLVKGILTGEITEYDLWADLTNVTPERAGYDIDQVVADIEQLFQELDDSIGGASDEDIETKMVMMHQKTAGYDEERSLRTILDRTLTVHMRGHLTQLLQVKKALGI